jgi:hypothetical protein
MIPSDTIFSIFIMIYLVKPMMIYRGNIPSETVYPHFPSPALPGAGSMGLISAFHIKAPLFKMLQN